MQGTPHGPVLATLVECRGPPVPIRLSRESEFEGCQIVIALPNALINVPTTDQHREQGRLRLARTLVSVRYVPDWQAAFAYLQSRLV